MVLTGMPVALAEMSTCLRQISSSKTIAIAPDFSNSDIRVLLSSLAISGFSAAIDVPAPQQVLLSAGKVQVQLGFSE